jgi:hypothetical protein
MHVFRLAKSPSRALRAAFLALLLSLGLSAVAHAGHTHDAAAGAATVLHTACGYCAAFTGYADAPRLTILAPRVELHAHRVEINADDAIVSPLVSSASPRGPPQA